MKAILRMLGWDARPLRESREEVLHAVVNRIMGTGVSTPVEVRHAQCIDSSHIRIYTDDGRQFCLTITEIG